MNKFRVAVMVIAIVCLLRLHAQESHEPKAFPIRTGEACVSQLP
jgi:hypothetical protein